MYTVGHSNHPLDAFLDLVAAHDLRGVVDVRAFPTSRRWPHFNGRALAEALSGVGVRYDWMPALGGRRSKGRPDSPHSAWTVAAFRNYADYTETDEFAHGLDRLITAASHHRTAFMCAEALYWQCHRRLIADRLIVMGHRVLHIQTPTRAAEHRLPDFARVVDGRIIYDGKTQLEML